MIEGASYTLSVHPDPKLEGYVDGLIEKIAAAQEPDGYLYTTRTINPKKPHAWAGQERWVLEVQTSRALADLAQAREVTVEESRVGTRGVIMPEHPHIDAPVPARAMANSDVTGLVFALMSAIRPRLTISSLEVRGES